MGLAASQARLLLLTARKSDLEYRAQCITNTEMILAMQTEAVARQYSQKISNQALFYTNADNTDNKNVALSSGNFALIVANAIAAGYKLQIMSGFGDEYQDWEPDENLITYTLTNNAGEGSYDLVGWWGSVNCPVGQSVTITKEQYESLRNGNGDAAKYAQEHCTLTKNVEYNNSFDEIGLLEALNNGTLRIVDASGNPVSLSANTGFVEAYYTDDDAEAEAEYKRATAAIQVKEKRLQMDLQQVESQQKACETEIDSVKKVIEKNIEKTFKVFS